MRKMLFPLIQRHVSTMTIQTGAMQAASSRTAVQTQSTVRRKKWKEGNEEGLDVLLDEGGVEEPGQEWRRSQGREVKEVSGQEGEGGIREGGWGKYHGREVRQVPGQGGKGGTRTGRWRGWGGSMAVELLSVTVFHKDPL